MRKNSLRTVLILLLVLTSIFSYTFINTVTIDSNSIISEDAITPVEQVDDDELVDKNTLMPDVEIVKLILEKGKQILPAS